MLTTGRTAGFPCLGFGGRSEEDRSEVEALLS